MHNILVKQPIQRIFLASLILVAIVPLIFLAFHLYQVAWEDSWREVHEKHKLLAQNLASPISIYIDDHRNALGLVADNIRDEVAGDDSQISAAQLRLTHALSRVKGFRSLSLVSLDGEVKAYAGADQDMVRDNMIFSAEKCYVYTRKNQAWRLSGVKPSPITGEPSLVLTQPVFSEPAGGTLVAVLLAELRIELIEQLRRNIKFGKLGHAAIVDQRGHVIAHPNPAWMKEMRDLSKLPVIQKMLAGKTGVTEFYSPHVKENMVAGYTSVPEIGWGIMVPQPKSEVSKHVNELMQSHIVFGVIGLILSALLAFFLSRWITRPIELLAASSKNLVLNDFRGDIYEPDSYQPKEISNLSSALQSLVSGLQSAHIEVVKINTTLEEQVDEATKKLQDANAELVNLANNDYLTALPNRRQFEESLSEAIFRRGSDKKPLCILLIDIDNFKSINDQYGHAAGDKVLIHVARILESTVRACDLISRYGGDEFAIQLRCDETDAVQKAWDIRESIKNETVEWEDNEIQLTASIGVSCHPYDEAVDLESIVHDADAAMYKAKQQGKNTVVNLADHETN